MKGQIITVTQMQIMEFEFLLTLSRRRQILTYFYVGSREEIARMSNCNSVFSMTVGCAEDVLKLTAIAQ